MQHRKPLERHRARPGWFAVLVVCSLLAIAWQWRSGAALVDSNILNLLPTEQRDPVVQQAYAHVDRLSARQHILLVGASSWRDAAAAATQMAETLCASSAFAEVVLKIDDKIARTAAGPPQQALLSAAARERLQSGGGAALLEHGVAMLNNPTVPLTSALLASDPFLLYYEYIVAQLPPQGRLTLRDGFLAVEDAGRFYILLRLTLAIDPYSMAQQSSAIAALDAAGAQVRQQFGGAQVLDIGALRYAAAGVESARDEVNQIGSISLVGVVAMLLIVFRSPLPMVASLLAGMVGLIAAVGFCWLAFGSIHMLTLVFGSSLLGISIDHCLHFFADRLGAGARWTPANAMQRIFPGITLGLTTTIVGYAALFLTGFPVMQQMAVFSCIGLIGAYLTVIWLYPLWIKKPAATRPNRWLDYSERLLQQLRPAGRRWPWLLAVPAAALLIAGLPQLTANDDLRALQPPSSALQAIEHRIRDITGINPSLQFFVIEGDSAEAVLQQEEALTQQLDVLRAEGALDSFDAVSRHLPSQARQRHNLQLLRDTLANDAMLRAYSEATGLDFERLAGYRQQVRDTIAAAGNQNALAVDSWLASDTASPWRHLWIGATGRGYASLVMVAGVRDGAALQALAAAAPEHRHWLDKVGEISALLKLYRERGTELTLAAYALVLGILVWRYGLRIGLGVMLPTALAAALTLAGLALWGEQLNLFHFLALLLVLGVGIDYSLFIMEDADLNASTMLAILLSAIANELSFGLLAVSSTPAVHAFGITTFLGIASAALLAPLVVDFKNKRNKHEQS